MSLAFPKPVRKEKKSKGPSRSRMRRKRPRRIDRETPAERFWKGPWIHSRRCVGLRSFTEHVCISHGSGPVVQQAHFRDHTGLGLKASNFQSLPMCAPLHAEYDSTSGVFAPMGLVGKKEWFRARLLEERADFQREHGCMPEDRAA